MKAFVSYLAVTALIIASSFTVSQQKRLNQPDPASSFLHFNVHRAGKAGIELAWTFSESGISRFIVERSYDGESFDPVTTINFNGPSSYKTKDTNEFAGVTYYRITAITSDGNAKYSPVESVRTVKQE